jgi:hypothetical protein
MDHVATILSSISFLQVGTRKFTQSQKFGIKRNVNRLDS